MREEIRELRRKARASQYAIAKRAGMPRSRISEIENGHVSPSQDEITAIKKACQEEVRARVAELNGVELAIA